MNIEFIADGAAVEAEGGALFDRKDPMTGKVATRAAAATLADVEKVVAAPRPRPSKAGRKPDRRRGRRCC
jgi:acyl-CoA reductase-like NAD-dependent aldehyde dehydrogenase